MSRRKPDQGECGERWSVPARFARRQSARGDEGHKEASNGFRSFVLCIARFAAPKFTAPVLAALLVLAFVGWGAEASRAQVSDAEKASYADAMAYCRWNVPRPIALRNDKRVLCFDGQIDARLDLSVANDLEQGGLFVVRSTGGEIARTIELADLLQSKQATVVVNGYCLANCANYLFIASLRTFVPKDALVAWRNVTEPGECVGFSETNDYGAPRFHAGPCTRPFRDDPHYEQVDQLKRKFYEKRILSFEAPPESVSTRKALKRKFDGAGLPPYNAYWIWNPRFYATAIRTEVLYEAYPQSQDEVDAIAARLGLQYRVIYDP